MSLDQGLTLRPARDDLGADHLPKQRLLGIEVEVERSFAHSGQPGDIVQLGARKPESPKTCLGRVEDLLGPRFGAALPAGAGGCIGVRLHVVFT